MRGKGARLSSDQGCSLFLGPLLAMREVSGNKKHESQTSISFKKDSG